MSTMVTPTAKTMVEPSFARIVGRLLERPRAHGCSWNA